MDATSPHSQKHDTVKRQLQGALWLLLVTVVATTAGVWMSLKYSELAHYGRSQLAAVAAAPAGTVPLSGWAWSGGDGTKGPYMGWISFSSDNDPAGAPVYGVYENVSDGLLSGYAWSSNLGWVSFNATDVATCPSGGSAPRVDLSTGKVSGWARACSAFSGSYCSGTLDSRSGGWDGCVSLATQSNETVAYGITQDPATCNWSGYAWGSTAIGWVNVNGGTTYGVKCAKPDLRAQYVDQITAQAGTSQDFTTTVSNIGSLPVNAPFYNLLQRADTIDASGNGINPQTANVSSFAGPFPISVNGTAKVSVPYAFSVPQDVGTVRYVRICVDQNQPGTTGDIAELNEQNNCTAWKGIQVGGPKPNLRAWEVTPTTASVGVEQTYSAKVSNNGVADVPNPYYALFQRVDAIDANGNAVGTPLDINVLGMPSGLKVSATTTVNVAYTFPQADAGTTRYLRVCADANSNAVIGAQNDVLESSETDNCGAWTAVVVEGSNLQADAIGYNGGAPTPTVPTVFFGSVKNIGTAGISGGVPSILRIKSDALGSRVYARLDAGSIPSIAAGATNVSLPNSNLSTFSFATSSTGTYYADVCVNMNTGGTVPVNTAEPYPPADNCGQNLTVVVRAPNLTVIPGTSYTVVIGTPLTVSASVRNIGDLTTGQGFTVNFQRGDGALDANGNPTGTITPSIGTGSATTLAAGATQTVTMSTTYSGFTTDDVGQPRWIRACADKSATMADGPVKEFDVKGAAEGDNCGPWTAVTVGGLPDVQANAVTASKTNPTVNEAVTFNTTVSNLPTASGPANDFPTVIQIASPTDPATNIRRIAASPATTTSLAVGATTGTLSASFATSTPGQYRVRACANMYPSGALVIPESNTGNNCSTSWVLITVDSGVAAPTVINPTHTAITTTGATLGATVSSNGGAALTARGTCWSTAINPSLTNGANCLAEGGTTVSTFSHARTGLTSGATIHYRGYATNAVGTGYTADTVFSTSLLGITVSPKAYFSPVWSRTTTVTYTLTNGDSANSVCRALDYAKKPLGTGSFFDCTGARAIGSSFIPNAIGEYGYYIQASSTTTMAQPVEDSLTIFTTSPFLTANGLSGLPSTASLGSSIALNGSVNNASTTIPNNVADASNVPSVYRVKTSSGGTPVAYIDGGSKNLPKGATGASAVALSAGSYTPTTAGTYYFDVCVNMGTDTVIPKVSESNASDNCGPESSVTVAGTCTVDATCTSGANNCGTTATGQYNASCICSATTPPDEATCDGGSPSITCTRNPNTASISVGTPVTFDAGPQDGAQGPYIFKNGSTPLCSTTGSASSCQWIATAGSYDVKAETSSASPTPNLGPMPCGTIFTVGTAETAPVITSFTADPLTGVRSGYTTTLNWTSSDPAAVCKIARLADAANNDSWKTGLPANDTSTDAVTTTDTVTSETVYTLTCTKGSLTSSAEVVVADVFPCSVEIGLECPAE